MIEPHLFSSSVWNILGILCALGTTMAFAVRPISDAVGMDWSTQKPSFFARTVGFFFGLRSYHDVLQQYSGGTFEEAQRNTDSKSALRGFVWAILTAGCFIVAILLSA
ncbi:MAG: hypothetical protein WAV21_02985 [Minisyncoccia bacterium]